MSEILLKSLTPTEKTKRQNNYPCKVCNIDITIGEKYIGVKYNDGFKYRLFGAFHPQCWELFKIAPQYKKPKT